ncbi:MAG: uroporphyrinogen-III synthase [Brachymonas sp.]|nr:uroporphyrinogen-III synthase [Brachymonas sp.]
MSIETMSPRLPLIITRPAGPARIWLAALQAQLPGRTCHVLPLIEIAPVAEPQWQQKLRQCWQELARYHAAVFVSPAAVEHFFTAQPQAASRWQQQALRAWGVGPGTRRALLGVGVPTHLIDSPSDEAQQFDSEALWPLVQPQLAACKQADKRILRVRGADDEMSNGDGHADDKSAGNGCDWLGAAITQAGVGLHSVAAYVRRRPVWGADQMRAASALASEPAVWLFSSGLALRHLAGLLPAQDWAQATALSTHPRIAQAAQAMGFGRVLVCRPSLPDVVQSLQSAP